MNAIEILRAASRSVPNEDYVQFMAAVDAVALAVAALHEGRRAIGDHHAPNDCYATGPLTGDEYRDLVQCPACSFIAMYDAAIAKAKGESDGR